MRRALRLESSFIKRVAPTAIEYLSTRWAPCLSHPNKVHSPVLRMFLHATRVLAGRRFPNTKVSSHHVSLSRSSSRVECDYSNSISASLHQIESTLLNLHRKALLACLLPHLPSPHEIIPHCLYLSRIVHKGRFTGSSTMQ